MQPLLLLASTTSHKREPLITTLEVFSRLGLRDLDLNLSHLFEGNLPIDDVLAALDSGGQRVWIASGGWCDFYHPAPAIDDTMASVERQIALARGLGVSRLRLFYGRLPYDAFTPEALRTIARNIRSVALRHPDLLFMFENHDGASLRPAVCRQVLEAVALPNVRMNFDPINFERHGVSSMAALDVLRPLIAHVHLKGAKDGECCEFGAGDVDLQPVIDSLTAGGYSGAFTVEYEGPFDRTVRLYAGVQRARAALSKPVGPRT